MSPTGRVGSADSCADRGLAPGERVVVERFWRPQGGLDDIEGLGRCPAGQSARAAGRRLAAMPAASPQPDPAESPGASPRAGRQPTGVVTIPTQNVSPWGSLTIGRSCGPMRKPLSATRAVPSPTGVCRMGSPRTTAATVDPVGAIRSRTPVIRPRANQIHSTKRPVSPPSGAARTRTRLDRTVSTDRMGEIRPAVPGVCQLGVEKHLPAIMKSGQQPLRTERLSCL